MYSTGCMTEAKLKNIKLIVESMFINHKNKRQFKNHILMLFRVVKDFIANKAIGPEEPILCPFNTHAAFFIQLIRFPNSRSLLNGT
jgi:hypothetical protein